MDRLSFEKHRKTMRDLLLIFWGAAAVLLLSSLDGVGFSQLPHGGAMTYFAWFGPWFALLTGSLAVLLILTTDKRWREDYFDDRTRLVFGYMGIVWLCLTAFVFEVSSFLNYAHLVAAVFGAALLAVYLGYRNRRNKPQEMFP
jgi:hypothetical protein